MADYDFKSLSPHEFETLSHDLLERHFTLKLQAFASGRDGGIDLRHAPISGKDWIIQCKHYAGSGFAKLKSNLKNQELHKIERLKPERYIIVTSLALTPGNIDDLFDLLKPYCRSKQDIIGCSDLNAFLRRFPDVEKSHFKLWVTSEAVISRLMNNNLFTQSALNINEIHQRLSLFVHTHFLDEARKLLSNNRVCILSGNPGVGKTTLAEMLLIDYIKDGWNVHTIHQNVDEGFRVFSEDPEAKQVFYYDDFLGQISRGEKLSKNEDRTLLQFMRTIAGKPGKRFILTTREYILRQAKAEFEVLDNSNIDIYKFVLECAEYSDLEKANILANHLFFFGVPHDHVASIVQDKQYRRIIAHKNYNPRIVEWMTSYQEIRNSTAEQYPEFFLDGLANPKRLWNHAFVRQLSEPARNLLLLLATCGEAAFLNELERLFEAYYSARASKLALPRQSGDFMNALVEVDGTFVRIHESNNRELNSSDRVVQIHNPSIMDFLAVELRHRTFEVEGLLLTAECFEQIERLILIFRSFKHMNPSEGKASAHFNHVAGAIRRTFNQKNTVTAKFNEHSTRWSRADRSPWTNLQSCIRISTALLSEPVCKLTEELGQELFSMPPRFPDSTATVIHTYELLKNTSWCSSEFITRIRQLITNELSAIAEEGMTEESLYDLANITEWILENHEHLNASNYELIANAIFKAVPNALDDEISYTNRDQLLDEYSTITEIQEALGVEFTHELRTLNEAIAECVDPYSNDSDRDSSNWNDHQAGSKMEDQSEQIDSLFSSLVV